MSRLLLRVAALAALVASPGHAQHASPQDAQIVVTAPDDPRDPVAAFVEAVTVETHDQLARFDMPICPVSIGLPPEQNRLIEARMREIALHVGRAEATGCRPNVAVIFAGEGGDFVRVLRRERPQLFAALTLADRRDIMNLPGPVRAWHLIQPRGADGRPMLRITALESPGGPSRPVANGYRLDGVIASRLSRATRQDLALSFVVFDLPAIEGLTWLQIADHAAMRALARTGMDGLPPRRSILTLFDDRRSGGEAAGELTGWDVAYLRALYRTGNVVGAHQQRANMLRTMRDELAPPPGAPTGGP